MMMKTGRLALCGVLASLGLGLVGCESDSYLDPSIVGRWERTPVSMPILETLDLANTLSDTPVQISPVRPDDLVPDAQEYVIGPGDFITVSIFELISVGVTDVQNRAIDETGNIRLPIVGKVKASGLSPSQLEEEIIEILENKGIMQDATVSVVVQQSRQNLYTIIGAPEEGSTRFGPYLIPQPDFRLLQAIAQAGGVSNRIKRILIFRQAPLTPASAGETNRESAPVEPAPADAGDLIEDLLDEGNAVADLNDAAAPEDRPAPPSGVESGLESGGSSPRWVYVDGKFVRVEGQAGTGNSAFGTPGSDALSSMVAQRIIEVPYDKLINGDMRYNVVIRAGDVIRIPNQEAGFVYIMGQSNRPGAYTVPGEQDLTLKQLIASSGGLGGLANPERVDLIRRTANNQEVTIRLDLAAIFHGNEPDIFLKPDDLINIGSSGVATPLAVIRNGFRFTYGFGFVLDRNFGNDVFGDNRN
ncbi:polysaccharide biosynthesis/export family protein [Algisphaera agarilytica]|uniref:Polysaccharide export outer membrane protein n=1 Tax=Algisphaera agarilytica TaxID=1385975 RepID=A0A7X0H550_9BACT|nr:polysaccharide biosynthesis/export family protein [Algisphaera agarilytica]MBB6429298.1 polysaccharide export outer membrane protein [Algisphaera agarilytica]